MPYDTGWGQFVNALTNPPNPLQQFGGTVDLANKLMDFRANKAISDIYGQSIDPQTGQVDLGKFNALASQNPAALWKYGTQMQQAGTGLQAQGLGTSAQLQAAQDQLGAQAAYMQPLMRTILAGGTVTGADVSKVLADMPPGLVPPSSVANVQRQLAQVGPDGDASNIVRGAMFANEHGQTVLKSAMPNFNPQNVGGQIVYPQLNPMAPGYSGGAPLNVGLTPQNVLEINKWLKEPYAWTDKQGNPQQGTKADYYDSIGQNPYTLFSNGVVPQPGTDPQKVMPGGGPVSGVTTGRAPVAQPGTPGQPGAPATGAAPPTSGQATGPPTPLVTPPERTGPPQSTAATPPGTAETSQKAYDAAQAANQNLPNVVNPLINVLSVLRANPNLQTAGQETLQDVKQKLAAYGVNVPNMTTANAYQELAKYLAQAAANIPGASRSDLAALNSVAQSPHLAQGPQVIQTLTAKLVGTARLNAIALDQFNSQFKDPTEASKNSSQFLPKTTSWMSKQDATAYGIDEMTPDEIAAYYKGLSPAAKKRFEDSARDAYRLKGITPGATVGRPATPLPAPAAPPPPNPAPAPTAPPPPPPSGFMTPSQMYGSGAGSP